MKRVDSFKRFTKERERHDRSAMSMPRMPAADYDNDKEIESPAEHNFEVRSGLEAARSHQINLKKKVYDDD